MPSLAELKAEDARNREKALVPPTDKDRAKALELLPTIPASCSHDEWFRIAACLKRMGIPFETFQEWSKGAPEKYNEEACCSTWTSVAPDNAESITVGTLIRIRDKYKNAEQSGEVIPAPEEMYAAPADEESLIRQAADFIESIYTPGESFELVTRAVMDPNQKWRPLRPSCPQKYLNHEQISETLSPVLKYAGAHAHGIWIGMNPVAGTYKGKAASDADVTDFRYALVEADELSREEQWNIIQSLDIPVKSVVWSGGKSLHVLVKIDAGTDRELYRKRVAHLYQYLNSKGFKVDQANKNASRLTRLPGCRRGDDMQYLVAVELGTKTWA